MITFKSFALKPELLVAIEKMGFETPTPIQEKTIPFLLEGKNDLIAVAQTGTGKTAAFGLPLLQMIQISDPRTQGLILCPTRELCIQITKEMEAFSVGMKGLRLLSVYGGSSMETQIKALKKGVHIIVATPGRILDLSRRKLADLTNIDFLILDEADEMLNMGFKDELDAILALSSPDKKTWLFSATMPREVQHIASNYMKNPEQIAADGSKDGLTNIEYHYYMIHARDRYLALKRVADLNPDIYGIVFCRTRQDTKDVAHKLIQDGYNADALHGDLSQAQREQVMHRFRCRNIQMLVATDVAARGLDVNDLTHVVHFQLPDDPETFTHRSGRTGRIGKKGTSIVLAHLKDKSRLQFIEKKLSVNFQKKPVPTGQEVCLKQLLFLIDRMKKVEVDHKVIDLFLPDVLEKLGALSREDIIKHFVSLEFNRFLNYYKDAPDLNIPDKRESLKSSSPKRFTKMFIKTGKKDGLTPGILLNFINDLTRPKKVDIGSIEIQRNFSYFDIEPEFTGLVAKQSKKVRLMGRQCPAEVAEEQGARPQRDSRPPKKWKGRSSK